MFLGEVLSSRLTASGEVLGTKPIGVRQYAYRIRVVETFSVRPVVGQEIEVFSGTGGADCSFHFLTGQRYLIDTWEDGGALFTGTCLLTGAERTAEVELETLRMQASGRKVPDVMGRVGQYFPGHPFTSSDGLDRMSLPAVRGINVKLRPIDGGQEVAAQTDAAGMYRMDHVKPGQYKIDLDLSKGLVYATPRWEADTLRLTVPDVPKTGPMCRVSLTVGASGSISGRVLQRRGKLRIDEEIRLYVVGADGWPGTLANRIWPQDDGSFRLALLGPGRYRLEYHVRGRRDVVYPQQITLAEGEQKMGVEFRLPSRK